MSVDFNLKATTRDDVGTGYVRNLRLKGGVPAVIYGLGEKNINLKLDHNEVFILMRKPGFLSSILNLHIDGKKPLAVLIRSHQMHVVKKQVLHLDFQYVSNKSSISLTVPLEFINQDKNKALKSGSVFSVNKNEIEVSCLPKNLPQKILVDIQKIKLDQTIHQSDLILPTGVEFAGNVNAGHDLPIASIHAHKIVAEVVAETTVEVVEPEADTSSS